MKTVKKSIPNILLALFTLGIIISCEDPQKPPQNDNPPEQLISVGQAKEMFDTYTDRRVRVIKNFEEAIDTTKAFFPTRYGQYNYETVKQYLSFIEAEAALANVEIGGLRFYFTNYPNAETFSDGTAIRYPRQNSFVLLPTTEVDGKQQGFITRTTATGGRTVVLIKDWLQEQQDDAPQGQQGQSANGAKSIGAVGAFKPKFLGINAMMGANLSLEGDDVSLLLNESNLVPPPPQEGTDFDD